MTRITLLTAPHCALCTHAHEVLDRVALDTPIEIETLSLETPEGQAALGKNALPFPPLVLLDGLPYSYGRISERRLRRELATHLEAAQSNEIAPQRKDS